MHFTYNFPPSWLMHSPNHEPLTPIRRGANISSIVCMRGRRLTSDFRGISVGTTCTHTMYTYMHMSIRLALPPGTDSPNAGKKKARVEWDGMGRSDTESLIDEFPAAHHLLRPVSQHLCPFPSCNWHFLLPTLPPHFIPSCVVTADGRRSFSARPLKKFPSAVWWAGWSWGWHATRGAPSHSRGRTLENRPEIELNFRR